MGKICRSTFSFRDLDQPTGNSISKSPTFKTRNLQNCVYHKGTMPNFKVYMMSHLCVPYFPVYKPMGCINRKSFSLKFFLHFACIPCINRPPPSESDTHVI